MFGVIHQREGLLLGLEAGRFLAAPNPDPEHLDRDPPPDRRFLLREINGAEAPLPDHLDQLVTADQPALEPPIRTPGARAGESLLLRVLTLLLPPVMLTRTRGFLGLLVVSHLPASRRIR